MSESTKYNDEGGKERWDSPIERPKNDGHIWTGIFILMVGALALANSMGVPLPAWLLSWQMLLIAIGLFIGFRKGFRDGGWFVPVIVGSIFLVNEYMLQGDLRRHIWPMVLIIIGAFFVFKPRSKACRTSRKKKSGLQAETGNPMDEVNYSQDDIIDSTNIFSGGKRVILSKNFKGGDIVSIFGGCEIDLTQADMTTPAELEVTAIFGGATLIVPSNWAIKSEAVTIFGGIGDKRRITPSPDSPTRTLILRGTMIFGGMEIKSY
jgi:predicted membrane protein